MGWKYFLLNKFTEFGFKYEHQFGSKSDEKVRVGEGGARGSTAT
jgi:hypothetical protein